LALRQQLAVLKHANPRPRLTGGDRFFWVLASRLWAGWREVLHIVQPATVIRWHRQRFRSYWRWKGRKRGRPAIDQSRECGAVRELSHVGGLHHEYIRMAA
jgi:hypothetical protein